MLNIFEKEDMPDEYQEIDANSPNKPGKKMSTRFIPKRFYGSHGAVCNNKI